jgi:hypothetical protein
MDSCDDTPKGWVAPFGHPRINACSRLPVAFRSVPRPSSPPGAKASTECPSLARDTSPGIDPEASTMHRNHPQRPTTIPVTGQEAAPHKRITLAQHTTVASEHHCHRRDAETSGQTLRWQRPETHQNLIHPDKERRPHLGTPPASQFHPELSGAEPSMPIAFASPRYPPIISKTTEGGGGDRTRTDDPLLAKQVLSQLSYTPK